MRLSLALIPIAFLTASSNEINQSDWSGGPGVPGPNQYWYDTFKSETCITWDGTEGMIYLDMKSTQHLVGEGVGGTQFAYPADINGDGNVDIVTSSTSNEKHVWFENDGTGFTWTDHIIDSPGRKCYASYPVDIDGDSYIDVVGGINTSADDSLFWYRNIDGTGLVWKKRFIDTFSSPHCIYSADIDGDGDNDIVAGSYSIGVGVSWWENTDGAGTYWQRHIVTEDEDFHNFDELYLTDLDLDGDIDILSASHDLGSSDHSALLFWENVDGTGLQWLGYQFDTDPVWGPPKSVHAGDMDNDGDIDVLAVDESPPDWGRVYWFENMDGSCKVWEQHIIDDNFLGANAVRAADLTGDGHLVFLLRPDFPGVPGR